MRPAGGIPDKAVHTARLRGQSAEPFRRQMPTYSFPNLSMSQASDQLGAVLCHAAQCGFKPFENFFTCHSNKRASCQAVGNIGFEQPFRHIYGLGKRLAHKMQRAAGGHAMRLADRSQPYILRPLLPGGSSLRRSDVSSRICIPQIRPSIPTAGSRMPAVRLLKLIVHRPASS